MERWYDSIVLYSKPFQYFEKSATLKAKNYVPHLFFTRFAHCIGICTFSLSLETCFDKFTKCVYVIVFSKRLEIFMLFLQILEAPCVPQTIVESFTKTVNLLRDAATPFYRKF